MTLKVTARTTVSVRTVTARIITVVRTRTEKERGMIPRWILGCKERARCPREIPHRKLRFGEAKIAKFVSELQPICPHS